MKKYVVRIYFIEKLLTWKTLLLEKYTNEIYFIGNIMSEFYFLEIYEVEIYILEHF